MTEIEEIIYEHWHKMEAAAELIDALPPEYFGEDPEEDPPAEVFGIDDLI